MRSFRFALIVLFASAMPGTVANAETIDVTVGPGGSFVFSPADAIIELGDTVRWTWDSDGHNVGSGIPGSPTPAFLSGAPAKSGTTFELVFDSAFLFANPVTGNFYDYHCHPHGGFGMVGSIQVLTVLGDVNLDGSADLLDVARFVTLLASGEFQFEADTNGDGKLNLIDVASFVLILTGG